MARKRHRRTDRELFLATLSELSKGTSAIISRESLERRLRWTKEKYGRMKQQLLNEGVVRSGRARGGGIGLIEPINQARSAGLKLFISYCHADEALKNDLHKHLEPLRQMGLIQDWHDGLIIPGQEWEANIREQLHRADIILLLVSIDFINSEFCKVELKEALQQHHSGRSRVIPIILRSCLWQTTAMAELQALPKDALPVSGVA
jgi:hypothetical protein